MPPGAGGAVKDQSAQRTPSGVPCWLKTAIDWGGGGWGVALPCANVSHEDPVPQQAGFHETTHGAAETEPSARVGKQTPS